MPERSALLSIGACVADMVRRPDEADRAHPGTGPADIAYGRATTPPCSPSSAPTSRAADQDHLVPAGVRAPTDGSGSPTPAGVTVSRAGAPLPDTRELAAVPNSPPAPGR
ncbi:hypothetical protein [Streptomyces sp. NPDC058330]|uniref:hypothetical protein n=1 Tax=Streptomyces sp. NPDC058330 TaxID=3346449 RepID=UPI0036EBCEE8